MKIVQMAQLDGRKFPSLSKTPKAQNSPHTAKAQNSPGTATFRTPKSIPSPTFQQLLQGDATIWPSSPFAKHNDFDGLQSPTRKLTVISRVKAKAKKWRHSLSIKKKQSQSTNSPNSRFTPSWGVGLNDHEEPEEEDPEYLGAPMYESELAPEKYKQAARQNPRAVPVASEKHVLESSVRNDIKKQEGGTSSSKTMVETVTMKLAPAYGAVSDATQTIASRIADLSVNTSEPTDTRATDTLKDSSYGMDKAESSMEGRVHGQSNSPSKWSKGVSVTEYLMKKLEPGEDEKALSQVITEKITPTRSPHSDQVGMVERLKGAVTSFLLTEEPPSDLEFKRNLPPVNAPNSYSNASSSSEASTSISPTKKTPSPRKLVYKPQNPSSPNYKGNSSSYNSRSITKEKSTSNVNPNSVVKNTNSSSHGSMSNSAHSVPHEDKNERILQGN